MLVVEYKENEHQLSSLQVTQISIWAANKKHIKGFGSSDGCGDDAHNHSLIDNRLAGIQNFVSITPYNLGKTSNKHNPASRRVVLTTSATPIQLALLSNQADIYLIDASSSMSLHWPEIRNFPFPIEATVYIAKTSDCYNGQHIHKTKTGGPTEIWYPYWKVLQAAPVGSTIMFVSDFQSSVPISPDESNFLDRLRISKQIELIAIQY